ncbi:MAG: LPS export ABC transporter periplasmic protein LptC [Saprospirales bacterium]|nr:MAG: LPS export ABC transporter periplasmic protein LptC [Saprospirales bacterium]
MKKKLSDVFYILVIALLSSISLGACKNEMAEVRVFLGQETFDEVAFDVEIFYSDSAITKVRVESARMQRVQEENYMVENFSGGVFAEFFDEYGNLSSWVESERAIRNSQRKKITLYDNVILININNDTLRTEELIWDEREERIYNNRFFRFSNPTEEIYGYRFSSNQEFTEYSFSRGAGFLDANQLDINQ